MKKEEIINNLVKKWIVKAENDLITAERELTFDNPITDTICFHCQQTAEKYLKAYLVNFQIHFEKTHRIIDLLKLCSSIDSSFIEQLEESDLLTDYSINVRYPAFIDEPDINETIYALELSKKVKNFVLEKLNKHKKQI